MKITTWACDRCKAAVDPDSSMFVHLDERSETQRRLAIHDLCEPCYRAFREFMNDPLPEPVDYSDVPF